MKYILFRLPNEELQDLKSFLLVCIFYARINTAFCPLMLRNKIGTNHENSVPSISSSHYLVLELGSAFFLEFTKTHMFMWVKSKWKS